MSAFSNAKAALNFSLEASVWHNGVPITQPGCYFPINSQIGSWNELMLPGLAPYSAAHRGPRLAFQWLSQPSEHWVSAELTLQLDDGSLVGEARKPALIFMGASQIPMTVPFLGASHPTVAGLWVVALRVVKNWWDMPDVVPANEPVAAQEETGITIPKALMRKKVYVNDDGALRCNETDRHQCDGGFSWSGRRMDVDELISTIIEHFE